MNTSPLEHYFDVKTTQLDMVEDRGYIIPEHEKHIVDTLEDFRDYITNQNSYKGNDYWSRKGLDINKVDKEYWKKLEAVDNNNKFDKDNYLSWQLYWNANNDKVLLVYYFNNDKSIPVEFIRHLNNFSELIKKSLFDVSMSNVLISNNDLSTDSRKNLKLIPKTRFFLDDELTYNPVKNVNNQEYFLLSRDEVTEIERELKLDKSKFSGIKLEHAVVQYYGWEIGDVVKIIRTERHVKILGNKSINYRVVIV